VALSGEEERARDLHEVNRERLSLENQALRLAIQEKSTELTIKIIEGIKLDLSEDEKRVIASDLLYSRRVLSESPLQPVSVSITSGNAGTADRGADVGAQ
jgi:hypothetical protein